MVLDHAQRDHTESDISHHGKKRPPTRHPTLWLFDTERLVRRRLLSVCRIAPFKMAEGSIIDELKLFLGLYEVDLKGVDWDKISKSEALNLISILEESATKELTERKKGSSLMGFLGGVVVVGGVIATIVSGGLLAIPIVLGGGATMTVGIGSSKYTETKLRKLSDDAAVWRARIRSRPPGDFPGGA